MHDFFFTTSYSDLAKIYFVLLQLKSLISHINAYLRS